LKLEAGEIFILVINTKEVLNMKLIDEKGRLFGKINIFDLIVLLAIVIVVGGVGYKLIQRGRSTTNPTATKAYIVTVKCSGMPDSFDDALKKDDRIYYDLDGFPGAKIVNIKEVPAVITIQTDAGELVEAESPALKDVYVDLEVADKLDDPDIKIGRYAIAVGIKTFTLKTIYATATDSVIIDIKEK
jgi:hypothetical protein